MQGERKALGSACGSQRQQGRRAAVRKKARRVSSSDCVLTACARVCVCELAHGCMYCIFFLAQERVLGPRSSSPVAVERMLHHEHPYILKQGMGSPYSARIERIGLDFLRLNHAWLSCVSPIQLFSFFNHCMGGSERLRSSRETRQPLSRVSGETLNEKSREITRHRFSFSVFFF